MTSEKLQELKNECTYCKHCGSEPEIIYEHACFGIKFLIQCKCGIQTEFDTWEKVLEIWNRKAPKTKMEKLLEKLPTTINITNPFTIQWSETNRGFGEYYFYIKNEKIHCDNECDRRETIKRILCNLADNCILDDNID